MANKRERLVKSRRNGLLLAGGIIFAIGLVLLVLGLIMLIFLFLIPINDNPEAIAGFIALIVAMGVFGGIWMLIGATLYFVGRNQAKKQKNQNIS